MLGRATVFGRIGHAVNHRLQARQRISAVHFLRAVLLRLEHQHAFAGDAAVLQRQQPRFDVNGQRGRGNVKAQVHSAGNFIDVLAARALRPDGAEINLPLVHHKFQHQLTPPPADTLQ